MTTKAIQAAWTPSTRRYATRPASPEPDDGGGLYTVPRGCWLGTADGESLLWQSDAAAQVPLAGGDYEAKYIRRQQIRHITTDPALRL